MELVINPPQQVFDQLINLSGELNGWAHQPYDYRFYSENFDEYWFIAVVDKEKSEFKNITNFKKFKKIGNFLFLAILIFNYKIPIQQVFPVILSIIMTYF